ncbi:response regulator [Halobacteria archaeon AArc-m2/3/4]|uniref:histidine kinase n=1 Tax=Natronoglomus mannanivorans TaxID=2979990 RepID=A0AAP2YZW7_9EURY|nr:response regulator [Halobacteria archaeon AArc-xg1-1]MCU4973203.1 response regulator [Halobacteria archaeon AArc-m2/3/4]
MCSSTDVELLLVEDNADDARFVERLIHEHQSTQRAQGSDRLIEIRSIDHVDRLADATDRIGTGPPDVVLLDLLLPDSAGLETVESMVERAPTVPIVVLTGQDGGDIGAEAIRSGAQDYLVKGTITGDLLFRTLRYAIERAGTQRELVDRNHRLTLLNRIVRTDIRNDVSMIVGWGDQLRDRVDPADRQALEWLLDASHHALELTDTAAELMDVLDGDPEVHLESCDLTAILDAEIERLRRDDAVDVTVERLGSVDQPVTVAASPMLGSVFKHLLSNAAVHTDRARAEVTVTVELTSDRVTVNIADDGVGIPDSQKALLADPEARSDGESVMGAGLYLVTTVLEEFGGELVFDDNYPRGTVVSVTLDRLTSTSP